MGVLDAYTGSDANQLVLPIRPSVRQTASVGGYVNMKINTLNRPLILLQDLLISRIIIPGPVQAAIEAKLREAQNAEQYSYRLTVQRYESERKAIEAEGIQRFQDMVAKGITPSYLTWSGIEATRRWRRRPTPRSSSSAAPTACRLILNTGEGAATVGGTPVTLAAPPAPRRPGGIPAGTLAAPGGEHQVAAGRCPAARHQSRWSSQIVEPLHHFPARAGSPAGVPARSLRAISDGTGRSAG